MTHAPISFRTSVILPLCFMRTFVIFYAILHTLVRSFVLYLPTRHICSLPLLSVLTLLISLCSGLDKGIDVMATPL
ncbi:hypothetical protein BJ322DRAFT_1064138, partial [Thelephora terrestris]